MISPENITNFNRTEAELEEFLLFAILVAGKSAKTQAKKLEAFLSFKTNLGLPSDTTPFQFLEFLNKGVCVCLTIRLHKLGQYKRLENAFRGILEFKGKLSTITIDELESIKGIGSKTSRFFILHSRPNQQIAVLDTHILKWLNNLGYNVPKSTPSKKYYTIIENYFLDEADKRQTTPANLDLHIWTDYSNKAKSIKQS